MYGDEYWLVETYRWWFPFWISHGHYVFREYKVAERVAKIISNPTIKNIR